MQEKEIRVVDKLKGRLAEELIKLLFEESGYEVHCSGMEHILPLYTKFKPNDFDELESWIRRIPDFLIYKEGKSYFIEVKYVTKFYDRFYTRFEQYPDYPQVFVIVVTPTEIDCRTLNDIKNGIRFDNVRERFLEEIKERRQEKIEAGTFEEIDEEKLQTVFPEFQRSLNRLTIFGIDENERQRFHTYFLAAAADIIKASQYLKNV